MNEPEHYPISLNQFGRIVDEPLVEVDVDEFLELEQTERLAGSWLVHVTADDEPTALKLRGVPAPIADRGRINELVHWRSGRSVSILHGLDNHNSGDIVASHLTQAIAQIDQELLKRDGDHTNQRFALQWLDAIQLSGALHNRLPNGVDPENEFGMAGSHQGVTRSYIVKDMWGQWARGTLLPELVEATTNVQPNPERCAEVVEYIANYTPEDKTTKEQIAELEYLVRYFGELFPHGFENERQEALRRGVHSLELAITSRPGDRERDDLTAWSAANSFEYTVSLLGVERATEMYNSQLARIAVVSCVPELLRTNSQAVRLLEQATRPEESVVS